MLKFVNNTIESYKSVEPMVEEQFDAFLKENGSRPFERYDFAEWQNKAYKELKISFVYAWWMIRDLMRKKYRHDVDIVTDKMLMTPGEVLDKLNEEYTEPRYFYDEEKKKFYYKETTAFYTVRGKKDDSEDKEEASGMGD